MDDACEGLLPEATRRAWAKNQNSGYSLNQYKDSKKWLYLSCWMLNNQESEAMWKIYTKWNDGFLIKTTYGKLKSLFANEYASYIGKVRYVNYRDEPEWGTKDLAQVNNNIIRPFFCKRDSLRHEEELRVICFRHANAHSGSEVRYGLGLIHNDNPSEAHRVSAHFGDVVSEIILTPFSDPIWREAVKRTLNDLGLMNKLSESDIYTTSPTG